MAVIAYLCVCKPCRLVYGYTYYPQQVEVSVCPDCGKRPSGETPKLETADKTEN